MMMKKTVLIIMTLVAAMSAGAQNLTVLHMNDTPRQRHSSNFLAQW